MWREYLTPIGETIERARLFERMLAALDPAELEAVTGRLRHLDVPVLLVWGTAEEALGTFYLHQHRTREARACYERIVNLWQQFPESSEYVDLQKAASQRLLASIR